MESRIKVGIVGAGLSGLTAAYRLFQKGIDVEVFEAKMRVGGRVFTVLMKNYKGETTEFELGGQNITDGGESTNFLNLVHDLNLKTEDHIINVGHVAYYGDEKEEFLNILQRHQDNIARLPELAAQSKNIGELIDSLASNDPLFKSTLHTRMQAYEGLNTYHQSIYHNIETLKCMLAGGLAKAHESYENVGLQSTISNVAGGKVVGGNIVGSKIIGGNAKLPMAIAEQLNDKVHYNMPVDGISVSDSDVTLEFMDGSSRSFDKVILATPILTYHDIDLTDAKIDEGKLEQMKSIKCGTNYKIALPINLGDKQKLTKFVKDNTVSFFNPDETIQLLYVNDKAPNIEDFARVFSENLNHDIELASTEVREVDDVNYAMYDENISYNWREDPYTKGSYTGYSTDISEELDKIDHSHSVPYKSLFTPVMDKLFFVGEHATILECIGTMEAAVESGERIAKGILVDLGV